MRSSTPSPTAMPTRTGRRLRASRRARPVLKTEIMAKSSRRTPRSKTDGFQDDVSTLVHNGRSGATDGHHVRRKPGNSSRDTAIPVTVDKVERWTPSSLLIETAIEGVMLTAPCDLVKLWP